MPPFNYSHIPNLNENTGIATPPKSPQLNGNRYRHPPRCPKATLNSETVSPHTLNFEYFSLHYQRDN